MTEATDNVHLRIAELARGLHGDEADDEQVAKTIVAGAVAEIPGAQYAGLTVATDRRSIESFGATHEIAETHDRIQADVGEGPCLSAALHDRVVRVDDLQNDERWPKYRRRAMGEVPIRSVLSFQLFANRNKIGALNLFADEPNVFDLHAEDIGVVYATHAALAWNTIKKDQQFNSALANRDVIGQAKGILMERFDIDALAAFDLLKKLSQESNTKLVEIARQITLKR
ncbi:GAF and ANTAR domain-containing protein [Gordonia alkanivorans]|uniref:Response regulator receiver n=1 Tax=Gordonia alkanivorans CGMCC 6845 TaxID=1423140 RepID=W9D9D9_9ACTN|nr:GAF and ANTAR domain-containing protein [Gordonia alkanivorans]ETA04957.1 response regulator receiver [Gordonia alkanivorans CGMCC 6845]MDH3008676.1 GAF and ANTAR domain-containing protein [Gordonia alkanivorans]MDH3017482.1 GAF and ANTAR domain-containing protein [Gordonia alkanivorans]